MSDRQIIFDRTLDRNTTDWRRFSVTRLRVGNEADTFRPNQSFLIYFFTHLSTHLRHYRHQSFLYAFIPG